MRPVALAAELAVTNVAVMRTICRLQYDNLMTIVAASQLTVDQRDQALALLFPEQMESTRTVPASERPFPPDLLDGLFAVIDAERASPAGAILLECLPGAGANVWGPCVKSHAQRYLLEERLLEAGERHLRTRRARIVQAFRPVAEAAGPLDRFGMIKITTIWTMQRDGRIALPDPDPAASLRFFDQSSGVSDEFERVLLASFNETRDCPELNGLRSPRETLEGYRAGAPNLDRWWLARRGGEPVGVVILGATPAPEVLELSYLGVALDARRQRVGRALLDFFLRRAADFGAQATTLLVDQRNLPAIGLYSEFGFRKTIAQDVYLRVLQLT